MTDNQILRANGHAGNIRLGARSPSQRRQLPQAELTIHFGEQRIELSAVELAIAEDIEQLPQHWRDFSGQVSFVFRDMLGLPDDARYRLFIGINELKGRYRIEMQVGGTTVVVSSLLEAALATVSTTEPIARLERARRAAIEAMALEHPDALQLAASSVARRLREAGVRGVLPQSLVRDAKSLVVGTATVEHLTAEAAARLVMVQAQPLSDADDDGNEGADAIRYYESDFYRYDGGKWVPIPESELRATIARLLQEQDYGSQVTTRFVTDVITNLKGMALLRSVAAPLPLWIDDADGQPVPSPYLAFSNGMVRLDEAIDGSATLLLHDCRHFSTTSLPYDFDEAAGCPLWEQTLTEVFPAIRLRGNRRDNRILLLQEFCGYLLLSHNTSFEKFMVLCGDGANGKSTITNVIIRLLGVDNVSHVPLDRMDGEFRLWQMANKLANVVADMNRLDRIEEGLLKNLVSGDPIQVNRKNLPPVTMRPTAKLIFGTNHLPQVSDRSNGMWRRMIVVPFRKQFTETDRDLHRAQRLAEELPGIFNWAIVGARRLLEQRRFTRCDVCEHVLEEHRLHSDPVAQFFQECVEKPSSEREVSTRCGLVYECFQKWCEQNGRRPMSSTEFGKQILAYPGVERRRAGEGTRQYKYHGIQLSGMGRMLIARKRPSTS